MSSVLTKNFAVKLTRTRAKKKNNNNIKKERWVKLKNKWGKNWEGARGQGV